MERVPMFLEKIDAISIISAFLDVIFHVLLAPTYNYDYPPSLFVQSGLLKPAAGIALLIIFFLLGVVFMFIQENLPGPKLLKGIRFGVSFGGLWLIGVIGMSIFFDSPVLHEVLGGACDCAALIILGILLGVFTATDNVCSSDGSPMRIISAIIIISLFFILGQYAAFILMNGTSYFNISGLDTFYWTAILGLWAGVTYWLLRQGIMKEYSPVKRSFFFGGVIIGINWILFNLFVLLFVDMPFPDPFILSVLNIVSIILGMFVFERLFDNRNAESSKNV